MSHESRQGRADRLRARADKAAESSTAAFNKAHDLVKDIPLGQPILVGHHSERRHRRTLERSDDAMRKAVELDRKAKSLYSRAMGAETNTAIYGDDPEAEQKLIDKIAELEAARATYNGINKLVRKKDTAAMVEQYGMTEAQAAELLKGDCCGRVGIPDYVLSNLSGNLRRYKIRLSHVQLKKAQAAKHEEAPRVLEVGEVTVTENFEADRLQITFPGKPDDETRAKLKSRGFRWSPTYGAWQANLHNSSRYKAGDVLGIDYPKEWYS